MTILTIVLPTYNGARYLPRQLDSILAQSRSDFELLVMDDGSSDTSVDIVDGYARRDGRIRRLPSTGNLGQTRRLRQLVEAASSRYVAFADQDDVWHPDRNALLIDAIGGRAVALGRSQLTDADGRDLGRSILEELGTDAARAGPLGTLFRSLVSAHAALVRRDWLDTSLFSSPTPFDWAIGVEALLSDGLIYVDEAVVRHRIHGGNQTNGGAVRARAKLLSLSNLRANTSFVQSDRLNFFLFIDQLSRSAVLPAATRRAFAAATAACRYAWYQPLNFTRRNGRRLEGNLHALLGPFASSAEDLAYFKQRVRSITRRQFGPVNIAATVSRYSGRS